MKKLNHKLFLMPFLFALVAFFSVNSVFAQKEIPMNVEIPFEFHVGNKSFSAGKYTISKVNSGAFLIRSTTGKEQIIASTPASSRIRKNVKTEKLVFNRYGDQYFLNQIFANRNADGFALLKSDLEEVTYREYVRGKSKDAKKSPEQVAVEIN